MLRLSSIFPGCAKDKFGAAGARVALGSDTPISVSLDKTFIQMVINYFVAHDYTLRDEKRKASFRAV